MSDVLLTLYLTPDDNHLRAQIRGTGPLAPDLPIRQYILPSVQVAMDLAARFAAERYALDLPYGGCEIAAAPTCLVCGHTLQLDEHGYCALCAVDVSQESDR